MIYKHPYSRGFSAGCVQEGFRRWHVMFWKWEWHYSVPMTDPDYVRKQWERQILQAKTAERAAKLALVSVVAELDQLRENINSAK